MYCCYEKLYDKDDDEMFTLFVWFLYLLLFYKYNCLYNSGVLMKYVKQCEAAIEDWHVLFAVTKFRSTKKIKNKSITKQIAED